MRVLMISLDTNILNHQNVSAARMRLYGARDELYILIPSNKPRKIQLTASVEVETVGGNKCIQFFRLILRGVALARTQQVEQITTQDPFFAGCVGLIIKLLTRVRFEVQIHGDFYGSNYYRASGLKNLLRYYIGLFVLPRADRVRCVGERIKQSLLALGIEEEKIFIKPVHIDTEYIKLYQPKFDVRAKYPDIRKLFLCLGRLDPVKNISWLVEVFAEAVQKYPNVMLLIVGEGIERNKIARKIKQLRLEKNIKVEGITNDPYSYLKTVDCLVFPSLSEGYGMVVIEALAAGCEVIMNDVGVAGFEVRSSEQVNIVSVNDREKFKKAIEDICR